MLADYWLTSIEFNSLLEVLEVFLGLLNRGTAGEEQ
jgi:hypothetical protein